MLALHSVEATRSCCSKGYNFATQVHLTSEEHELQARVEQQRDQHLQILRQEHSTKADRQLQVQTQVC